MPITIVEEEISSLTAYATVPIAFDVTEVIDLDRSQSGDGTELQTRPIGVPFRKDYDAIPGNDPLSWATQFDPARLILLSAFSDEVRVGGAAVLMGRSAVGAEADTAILHDLRVAPASRGRRVASTLLMEVERVAAARGARILQVETQDINVPACRFYARRGFQLSAVNRNAYPSLPREVQLLWTKPLTPRPADAIP